MSVRERAAKAAWAAVCATNDERSGGYVGTMHGKPFYVDGFIDPEAIVRAVLMVVRESDETMVESWWTGLDDHYPNEGSIARGFTSMIDTILKENA